MAALKQRHNKWEARVRVPKSAQDAMGGKQMLYRTLKATDRRTAKVEALAWEAELKAGWEAQRLGNDAPIAALRRIYESMREKAERGEFTLQGDRESFDEITAGIEYELEKLAERAGGGELGQADSMKVMALQDAKKQQVHGRVEPRAELELSFRALADEYLRLWRTTAGLKPTNTEQHKKAIFDLFQCYFGDKPIRQVRRGDVSNFVDALRQMDPHWARTGKPREDGIKVTWPELQRRFGGREKGLADATVNRHMGTLSTFWNWAEEREHCEGRNPFDGHRRSLKQGKNKHGYVAWEIDELKRLFDPPPKRDDIREVMLVALHSGMRLNEIASLTNGQIKRSGSVTYMDVTDAKTAAGVRKVPVHPALSWLVRKAETGSPEARIWPRFNDEGPGKKPSGDAGKVFSSLKIARGFDTRMKVFHSFRKNVVGQLEAAGIPQNEVAQLVGHEKQGLTFGTYGKNMSLERLAEIIAIVRYPDLDAALHPPKSIASRP